MYFRQLLNDETACASYLLGCKSKSQFAVVDPHVDLVEQYVALAEAQGIPIVAVFETHVQADHVSGLPELVARTGATAYLPAGTDVEFDHVALDDGQRVELGNTTVQALAALLDDIPPVPARQVEIVAANRSGRPLSVTR